MKDAIQKLNQYAEEASIGQVPETISKSIPTNAGDGKDLKGRWEVLGIFASIWGNLPTNSLPEPNLPRRRTDTF